MKEFSKLNNISIIFLLVGILLFGGVYVIPSITGMVTGPVTIDVTNVTTITLPTGTVAFGNLAAGATNNTTDDSPLPFIVQNDGNVNLNISIEATDLWSESANPTVNFESKCGNTSEWKCEQPGFSSNITFSPIPDSGNSGVLIYNLSYKAAEDTVEIDINITVPSEEAGGSKSSTVTFTASNFEV